MTDHDRASPYRVCEHCDGNGYLRRPATSEIAQKLPEQHWGAIAKRVGTNETMHEVAQTKEELDTKLFGQAYPAAANSIFYYRFTPDPAVSGKTKGD